MKMIRPKSQVSGRTFVAPHGGWQPRVSQPASGQQAAPRLGAGIRVVLGKGLQSLQFLQACVHTLSVCQSVSCGHQGCCFRAQLPERMGDVETVDS